MYGLLPSSGFGCQGPIFFQFPLLKGDLKKNKKQKNKERGGVLSPHLHKSTIYQL
jgi:hypothetical protein